LKAALLFVAALSLLPAGAFAQHVEADPLQCWWRTSTGAIRVGEAFSAVLTCAVVETDDVKVVVDESRLEPSVAQFVPFEVLGGSHAADLRRDDRRFFQYEYRLRLISENMFGKDVALPETKLTYRIQSKVSQKAAVEGRDQTYLLPALSMRLLSLVPADASDIRDASTDTFADVDRRAFRANLLVVIGGILFALAALVGLLTIVRLVLRARKPSSAADRLVSDGAILREAGRQLAAVQRQREDGGWTSDLAARALAALRVIATYAMGNKAARTISARPSTVSSQSAIGHQPPAMSRSDDGRLLVRTGWPKSKTIAVSGAATARSVAQAARSTNGNHAGELQTIEDALSKFTAAQYRQPADGGRFDDSELDAALASVQPILRQLKIEQTWPMKRLRRQRRSIQGASRAWSH